MNSKDLETTALPFVHITGANHSALLLGLPNNYYIKYILYIYDIYIYIYISRVNRFYTIIIPRRLQRRLQTQQLQFDVYCPLTRQSKDGHHFAAQIRHLDNYWTRMSLLSCTLMRYFSSLLAEFQFYLDAHSVSYRLYRPLLESTVGYTRSTVHLPGWPAHHFHIACHQMNGQAPSCFPSVWEFLEQTILVNGTNICLYIFTQIMSVSLS